MQKSSERAPVTKTNVLIYPAGSENGLEILDALGYHVDINVIGATNKADFSSLCYADLVTDLPPISSASHRSAFLRLVRSKNVSICFATHDSVALTLAQQVGESVTIPNPDLFTNRACRDKGLTYSHFRSEAWCPWFTYSIDEARFPCVFKMRCEQGGQGFRYLQSSSDVPLNELFEREGLLCEYLPGEEVTVDCYTDRAGELLHCGPRLRARTLGGISTSCVLVDDATISSIAAVINSKLKFWGPWYFQLKRDGSGSWKLMEISARCSGAMVAQRVRGVNLPLLFVHEVLGNKVEITPRSLGSRVERRLVSRAAFCSTIAALYIDYDDTLIVRDRVNAEVLALMYQAISSGVPVSLITRHAGDLSKSLRRFRLFEEMFDQVHHIGMSQSKVSLMCERSLLVDNSYAERAHVNVFPDRFAVDVDAVPLFSFEFSRG